MSNSPQEVLLKAASAVLLAAGLVSAATPDWQEVRREERFRKHGALQVGSRVGLGPVDRDNWNPEQARHVGAQTRVVELVPEPDARGCYGVRVEADGAVFFWRVRNLEGEGLFSGEFLQCEEMEGTKIPICVVPVAADIPLFEGPSDQSPVLQQVPLFAGDNAEAAAKTPRYLFVHERRNGFLHVMESDYGSRETLGWVRADDTVAWPTRQGYILDPSAAGSAPLVGYADHTKFGQPGADTVTIGTPSGTATDPNQTGLCDGLLLQRRMVRGVQLSQCSWIPPGQERRQLVWLPTSQSNGTLVAYVLMSEFDLIELSAQFARLYAACINGYIDDIREALEEEWDAEAKAMIGTRKRAVSYARFYREVQAIYPALTRRLELPPGETTEAEFVQIAERAAESQAQVQRIIDEMNRDKRHWAWVRVDQL